MTSNNHWRYRSAKVLSFGAALANAFFIFDAYPKLTQSMLNKITRDIVNAINSLYSLLLTLFLERLKSLEQMYKIWNKKDCHNQRYSWSGEAGYVCWNTANECFKLYKAKGVGFGKKQKQHQHADIIAYSSPSAGTQQSITSVSSNV